MGCCYKDEAPPIVDNPRDPFGEKTTQHKAQNNQSDNTNHRVENHSDNAYRTLDYDDDAAIQQEKAVSSDSWAHNTTTGSAYSNTTTSYGSASSYGANERTSNRKMGAWDSV